MPTGQAMSDDPDPRDVVLDLVLRYVPGMPRELLTATVSWHMHEDGHVDGTLTMLLVNHRGQRATFSVTVVPEGIPVSGDAPRFIFYQIHPGVWKLAPSLRHDLVHAFITVVGMPDGEKK